MPVSTLTFLKLGGSLITDKTQPYTPRREKLADLAAQIAISFRNHPDQRLLLGHGSGSFGHTAAKRFHTRDGVPDPSSEMGTQTQAYWEGFAEVGYQAAALNRIVMEALHVAGLPAVAFPPSASVTASDGRVVTWDISPLKAALKAGMLPVMYGDVIFDQVRGGTILSTEDLMLYLAGELRPARILLAGLEEGVWQDFPARTRLLQQITPNTFSEIRNQVGSSHGVDVTGGMSGKVEQMLKLVQTIPGLRVHIFSGENPGNLQKTLTGEILGTLLTA